ncbi:polysaccharide biosynthesis protein [Jeotgalibaca sp. MA1X17-3]|uniref:polysaccharide biosynthesis protein n=1 Tax=Jeotgalibaca sp. MA1X17-3 TaxID=2908211 RepID=UPI001F1CD86F|nr:nucleoside-diphosphate sugar epimerase/dehydratase [Jeotgalibaca sp. MA1X17-3]UJF15401.1 polysaccharide biosynthesis protein [Jeotgalibaca sp. MA1X17-3]
MNRKIKKLIMAGIDVSIIVSSALLATIFLDPFIILTSETVLLSTIFISVTYLSLALYFRMFSRMNHYTGLTEVIILTSCVTAAFLTSEVLLTILLPVRLLSLRFILLTYLFSTLGIIGSRTAMRLYFEYKYRKIHKPATGDPTRTLIVGGGQGGSILIRRLRNHSHSLKVMGIVDDDPAKQGGIIFGVQVMGAIKDIPHLVTKYQIEQVTIAAPSLPADRYEAIVDLCNYAGVPVNKMPYIEDVLQGKLEVSQFREVNVVDLLGREEVKLDMHQISTHLTDKVVLVSGAGGSIGSEICRQIAAYHPQKLLLLGHGENSIYQIDKELTVKYGQQIEIIPLIADIQDRERIFEIMKKYKPNQIYHAAAHKHVPMMEYNPHEAVKNNIYGTKNMAEAAKAADVESFVMISTDKAVNPPNVMGATKRVSEMIVTGLNEIGKTKFAAVRFGNVLGSRGSVVPLFQEQIKKGGPLTVTDFEMTRYFMTIPEASRLVIQAGALASGGEIFILDMGEPVKILDLAKKIIKLSGYTEKEIPIVETGMRPGEKLYEELLVASERTDQKVAEKIFVGKVMNQPLISTINQVEKWMELPEKELKKEILAFANTNHSYIDEQEERELVEDSKSHVAEKRIQGGYINV